MVLFDFNNVIYVFLLLWLCILIVCLCMATLTEVFPCFFLSCIANSRVKPPKTGHGPHSFQIFVLFYGLFVLFYVFVCCYIYGLYCVVLCIVCVYMCTVRLPPGGYPITVKYIISYHIIPYHTLTFKYLVAYVYVPLLTEMARSSDDVTTCGDGGGDEGIYKKLGQVA
jgi:hypothetical protein